MILSPSNLVSLMDAYIRLFGAALFLDGLASEAIRQSDDAVRGPDRSWHIHGIAETRPSWSPRLRPHP